MLLACFCRYVAIVSGLDLGKKSDDLLSLQMMIDLVTGQLGDEGDQKSASKIVRVLLAGNSLSQDTQDKDAINKVSSTSLFYHGRIQKSF